MLYSLAAIAIIAVAVFMLVPGISLMPGAQVATQADSYAGPITPRLAHQDALSVSTTYGEGSAIHTTWLRCTGCVGVPDGGYNVLTTGNNTFSSLAQDNNVVFAAISGRVNPSGSDGLYLGITESLNSNPGILTGYSYTDYDNDGVEDHVFRVSLASISLNAGQTTLDLPVNGKWYNYEAPTGAVQEPGAFLVEVGQAQNNTQVFRFRLTSANFDTAALVREIHLTFNSSETALWSIDKMVVPFWDSSSQSFVTYEYTDVDVGETVLSTNSTYKFFFADDLSDIQNGNYIMATKTGGTKYNDILVYVTWTLGLNDHVTLDARVKIWTDDQIETQAQAEIAVHEKGPNWHTD
jgi:hypothetical protein